MRVGKSFSGAVGRRSSIGARLRISVSGIFGAVSKRHRRLHLARGRQRLSRRLHRTSCCFAFGYFAFVDPAGGTTALRLPSPQRDQQSHRRSCRTHRRAASKRSQLCPKPCNFGLLYRMGDNGFYNYLRANFVPDITFERACELKGLFFAGYPDLARWQDEYSRHTREQGFTQVAVNRSAARRRVPTTGTAFCRLTEVRWCVFLSNGHGSCR